MLENKKNGNEEVVETETSVGKFSELYQTEEEAAIAAARADAEAELEDEFAADFGFILTDSQEVAISEIKSDMMKPSPMNRLL